MDEQIDARLKRRIFPRFSFARLTLGFKINRRQTRLMITSLPRYNGFSTEGDRTIIQHPVDKFEIQELWLLIHRHLRLCEYLLARTTTNKSQINGLSWKEASLESLLLLRSCKSRSQIRFLQSTSLLIDETRRSGNSIKFYMDLRQHSTYPKITILKS